MSNKESVPEKALELTRRISENPPEKEKIQIKSEIEKIDNWKNIPAPAALNLTGGLIDYSSDLEDVEGLNRAKQICEKIEKRDLDPQSFARVNYQLANIRSNRNRLKDDQGGWKNNQLFEELIYRRKSTAKKGVKELPPSTESRIYSNLGDAYLRAGRVTEALRYWDKVISKHEDFAMSYALRGLAKIQYADLVFYEGQKRIFYNSAYQDLKKATESDKLHTSQQKYYLKLRKNIENFIDSDFQIEELEEYKLGKDKEEIQYREWCLDEKLFLNPLNDIITCPIAAHDVLHLPNMEHREEFAYPGFFNQMKQEFVSARYMFYEGLKREETHFSDYNVKLINTLDYPKYSYSVEQMKASLRLSYSLFDKIGLFLNDYFELGLNERKAGFGKVWYKNGDHRKSELIEKFKDSENWALMGLYWIKKDIFDASLNVSESIDLVAEDIREIRKNLEHQYLKVHDGHLKEKINTDKENPYQNDLRHSITEEELKNAALEVLRLSRASLIYLSLAVKFEEDKTNHKGEYKIFSDTWEDNWKK